MLFAMASVALVTGSIVLRPTVVIVAPVVRGTAAEAVYGSCTVEAFHRVTIKAKASGTVVEIDADEGQSVRSGVGERADPRKSEQPGGRAGDSPPLCPRGCSGVWFRRLLVTA